MRRHCRIQSLLISIYIEIGSEVGSNYLQCTLHDVPVKYPPIAAYSRAIAADTLNMTTGHLSGLRRRARQASFSRGLTGQRNGACYFGSISFSRHRELQRQPLATAPAHLLSVKVESKRFEAHESVSRIRRRLGRQERQTRVVPATSKCRWQRSRSAWPDHGKRPGVQTTFPVNANALRQARTIATVLVDRRCCQTTIAPYRARLRSGDANIL